MSLGSSQDIEAAVKAARAAYKTSWGQKVSGTERGRLLDKLADLMEKHADELSAIDALEAGEYVYRCFASNLKKHDIQPCDRKALCFYEDGRMPGCHPSGTILCRMGRQA